MSDSIEQARRALARVRAGGRWHCIECSERHAHADDELLGLGVVECDACGMHALCVLVKRRKTK